MVLLVIALFFASTPTQTAQVSQDNRQLQREQTSVAQQRRIALVIGNGAYQNVKPLKNPPNDATLLAVTLRKLGFEVTMGTDKSQREMKQLIREFGQRLRGGGGVGLFYFAGHGVQARGHNYLIPVDADIQTEADLEDVAVDVNYVLNTMDDAQNALNIAILDACRNNPFARSFRSAQEGLAQVKAPTGTLIAYATAPDSVAGDGGGANSPYAEELVKQLESPGVVLETMFRRVTEQVSLRTGGRQEPWVSDNHKGEFYFTDRSGVELPLANPAEVSSGERLFWRQIESRNTVTAYESYLKEYPAGEFVRVAKVRIGDLKWAQFKPMAQILMQYEWVDSFGNGLARTSRGTFIDRTGKEVLSSLKYDAVGYFSGGFIDVEQNGKFGFIDAEGREIVPPRYQKILGFSEGMAGVKLADKWGFIDDAGKEVVPPKYDDVNSFSGYRAKVVQNGKVGFIDQTGAEVIPLKYDRAFSFHDGLAEVVVSDKHGFIDAAGDEVIPLRYERASRYSEGLVAVTWQGKLGFIDKNGREVIPFKFPGDQHWVFSNFKEGLAPIMVYRKVGFINKRGEVAISPTFDFAYPFEDGLSQVVLNRKFGYIDTAGKEVVPIKYDPDLWLSDPVNGFFGVKLNGKQGFVDRYGNEYFDF